SVSWHARELQPDRRAQHPDRLWAGFPRGVQGSAPDWKRRCGADGRRHSGIEPAARGWPAAARGAEKRTKPERLPGRAGRLAAENRGGRHRDETADRSQWARYRSGQEGIHDRAPHQGADLPGQDLHLFRLRQGGAAMRSRRALLFGLLCLGSAATVRAQDATAEWKTAFPTGAAPSQVHFRAVYRDGFDRAHELEVWRQADVRLRRRTDDSLDLYVEKAGSGEYEYRLVDHNRNILI